VAIGSLRRRGKASQLCRGPSDLMGFTFVPETALGRRGIFTVCQVIIPICLETLAEHTSQIGECPASLYYG
jgi:hypothetical protein